MESTFTDLQFNDGNIAYVLVIAFFFFSLYLGGKKEISIKMDEDQLQILDDLPSSAVELQVKDKVYKYWGMLFFSCTPFSASPTSF
jgi:hypothetical protein